MYWMHKGFKNKNVKNLTEEEINEMLLHGWAEGKCPSHWITNGIDNKLLKVGNPIPDGYWYGQSDDFKLKNSLGGKNDGRICQKKTGENCPVKSQIACQFYGVIYRRTNVIIESAIG